jgi:molybdenum cofactor cytidylyltransferase
LIFSMKFGLQILENCVGAVLAHALSLPGVRLHKGHMLTAQDVELCRSAQIDTLIVARLSSDDVAEDVAAANLARALIAPSIRAGNSRTGRANLYATGNGVLTYNMAALTNFNSINEGITLAMLPPFTPVRRGQIIGTVKIIPFAIAQSLLEIAISNCVNVALNVHIYQTKSATLIQTSLPETKASVRAKTLGITRKRLEQLDGVLQDGGEVAHDIEALSARLKTIDDDIILIVGASAIADRADVIPASIEAAGGHVRRVGLPVDPGNLLCIGQLGRALVIGLPGCARSPKRNGLDMVLERHIAGLDLTPDDFAAMGSGGLLEDVAERALPRAKQDHGAAGAGKIGAIILAAGRSSRMGAENKLLLPTSAGPLVRRTADVALAAGLEELIVVLGHQAEAVGAALHGAASLMIFNPDFASGMASSICAGLAAAPRDWDGAFIMLGDMPLICAASLRALISAFNPAQGRGIIAPVVSSQRANPVLWGQEHWPLLLELQGDIGGKAILAAAGDAVTDVMLDDSGLIIDVDDPTSWQGIKALL